MWVKETVGIQDDHEVKTAAPARDEVVEVTGLAAEFSERRRYHRGCGPELLAQPR